MNDGHSVITLLTDFGEVDAFVGIMKGVILEIAPHAQLVDLSHLISPQDIKGAAYILMTAAPFFPKGTVHLVVVDPGVGSERRPIAVETRSAMFVAPDNGVLSYALTLVDDYEVVELQNPQYQLPETSSTFHGRDIFSPAAAHLAAGVPFHELGPAVENLIFLEPPLLRIRPNEIEAEVLNVDHFGNLRTSILTLEWEGDATLDFRPLFNLKSEYKHGIRFSAAKAKIVVGQLTINGISTTFSDALIGQPLAYVGSEGGLEIALNQGSFAQEYGIEPGDKITLSY